MAESVLVKPRRLAMRTVGQVGPNPSQQVHIFPQCQRSLLEHLARRSPKLPAGARPALGALFAAGYGTPSR
jgi:hypothetical protein